MNCKNKKYLINLYIRFIIKQYLNKKIYNEYNNLEQFYKLK